MVHRRVQTDQRMRGRVAKKEGLLPDHQRRKAALAASRLGIWVCRVHIARARDVCNCTLANGYMLHTAPVTCSSPCLQPESADSSCGWLPFPRRESQELQLTTASLDRFLVIWGKD